MTTSEIRGSNALPGTKTNRLQHAPPLPSGVPVDPGGATPVEHLHRLQQQAADIYAQYRASIPGGVDPAELKDSAGLFGVSDTALQLAGALAAVKAEAEAAAAQVNDLIGGHRVSDDVAAQLAATRYENRYQRTLDAIRDVPKLVAAAQNLVANASPTESPVLAESLGDYLGSRAAPTGWLPEALAAKVPGATDAATAARLAAKQVAVLQYNHDSLHRSFAKDVAAPDLLNPANVTADSYTDSSG